MNVEQNTIEYKSLKKITTGDKGVKELSVTCVCLANAQGGIIYIGIEDKTLEPPKNQIIDIKIINDAITRLRTLCFNVSIIQGDIIEHENGGEYFSLIIQPSLRSIATTSEGKIFVRLGDQCHPARSEDVLTLAAERDAFKWELQERKVTLSQIPLENIEWFANEIRKSDRVKDIVKQKTDIEIIEHYNFISNGLLTNLGILWLGTPLQRNKLVYPINVQYIVYDEFEKKIRKEDWNDGLLNPKHLIEDIEKQAIELKYYDEFPQGLFRNKVYHYDPRLLRELLINAIAHKSYTISGDIFIKVYTDRVEITNPGGLPLGVTNTNILHKSIRRNPDIIRVLHDLKLMEGEGSGYDLIYEIVSRDSKSFPIIENDFSTTKVIQYSKILDAEAVLLLDFIAENYQLTQKEFIAIGIVAREQKILSTQLSKSLQLSDEDRMRSYVNRLVDQEILITRGQKKATEFMINPKLIASSKINIKPTLKLIEPHRLKALILEDLKTYPNSLVADIHKRLVDVELADLRKAIYEMVKDGVLLHTGGKTYRRYYLPE
ncbi:ATP-binding protein [Bergeyella sp. RCAD1439]|uniref:ATP-binding protein n=1 Tax=Bergeyella anatis TaxID=3113737 RepID=UPI002E17999F|nr:ATP-binding protein [Bergeyella sp. RCAD1439]